MKYLIKAILACTIVTLSALPGFCQSDRATPKTIKVNCQSKDCLQSQKLNPWKAVTLNMLPFGIGSYQQGDTIGGVMISTIDTVSMGAIIYPFIDQSLFQGGWGAMLSIGYGAMGLGIGRIVGAYSPWLYQAQQKSKFTLENDPFNKKNDLVMDIQFFSYQTSF